MTFANAVIAGHADTTPPTVFLPQRNPYNPGGYEWGTTPEASDFEVTLFGRTISLDDVGLPLFTGLGITASVAAVASYLLISRVWIWQVAAKRRRVRP